MLILIDLDGTLINTVHPSWKPYKDGQENCSVEPILAQVPLFTGAKEFIESRKSKGDSIVVVSDSHFRYVNPICKMLSVDCVSLADKPNTKKLNEFLASQPDYKQDVDNGNCFVIGDTKLDIEMGRHIGAMTIWFLPYRITDDIKDERDGIGDEMLTKKMGPTFTAKKFVDLEKIVDSPLNHLYAIEAAFAGSVSSLAIRLFENRYSDGSFACIRCLARQEQGVCDRYARADKYYMISNPQRSTDFLQLIASGIANYINQPSLKEGWDYITYLTDKQTTTPPNKMKEIFERVQTTVPKVQLLKWADNVEGSLRQKNLYGDRQAFLQSYLSVENPMETIVDMFGRAQQTQLSLKEKNVIVLDDQLTTGATAWHVIRKLKENGVRNVLFIAFFQMVLPVNNDVVCPRCGQLMLIKMRRSDGIRFYSCTPHKFGGNGCGYSQDIQNISDQNSKFISIQEKYKWGFDRFIDGKESLPNFKQIVIDSEEKIKIIDMMGMYGTGASDADINYMQEILANANELIFNNPLRNNYWEEYVVIYSSCDYYDSYGYSLEYAIQNLDEIDEFIEYKEIEEKYPESVDAFLKNKQNVTNKFRLVIDSASTIKLIDKHELYIRCCQTGVSDDIINYMIELDRKAEELIYSNRRKDYYRDFTYSCNDNYDHELSCLEYALEHLNELDKYIDSIEK